MKRIYECKWKWTVAKIIKVNNKSFNHLKIDTYTIPPKEIIYQQNLQISNWWRLEQALTRLKRLRTVEKEGLNTVFINIW